MIKYNNTNNASTTLTAGISPSNTTLIVENGDILPTAPFLLTLEHFDNEKVTVREIVKCIAKVGTILTIQRGAGTCVQDDSATPKAQNNTPHSFSVGDVASIYWTSEQVQDIQNEIEKKLNIDDFQAGTYVYGATSTGTDAYSITIPGTLTSYAVGQVFRFMADTENTGNATLNVNGIGEKEILKNHDQHLQSGDIEAGQIVEVAYDGTNFQMDSQIASVISLDDISSLSYNDLTCYAGEDIKENDVIVTNGNSFNPDRADEGVAVGGTTINKYAIGFVGNGETTDTFSIKTSVDLGTEPDSVTINLETDDNGKPSGTVLATSSDINIFKSPTDYSSFLSPWVASGGSLIPGSIFPITLKDDFSNWNNYNTCWIKYGQSYAYTLTLNGNDYFVGDSASILSIVGDKIVFRNKIIKIKNFINISLPDAVETVATFNIGIGTYDIFISNENGTVFYHVPSSSNVVKIYKLTNPFDFSDYTTETFTAENVYSQVKTTNYCNGGVITNENGERLLIYYARTGSSTRKMFICKLDETGSIVSYTTQQRNGVRDLTPFNKNGNTYFGMNYRNVSNTYYPGIYTGAFEYSYIPYKRTFSFPIPIQTVKNQKYWLTIAPVRTGSVINCAVIYDREGEYFSDCAVRDSDLGNDRGIAGNKTPYIDAICIKAKYARKAKKEDKLYKIVCGFANGDYTNFETVKYCFSGVKSGFSGLNQNEKYFLQGNGLIGTKNVGNYVGSAIDETKLLVDFKNLGGIRELNSSFTDNKASGDATLYTYDTIGKENCILAIKYKGKVKVYINDVLQFSHSNSSETTEYQYIFEEDNIHIEYSAYNSSTALTFDLTYSFIK